MHLCSVLFVVDPEAITWMGVAHLFARFHHHGFWVVFIYVFLIVCECFASMCVCTCLLPTEVRKGQWADFLRLQLQAVRSHDMGVGNQTQVLRRTASAL